MGFRWKDAVKGGINGFRAGSRSGNPWVMLGTTAAGTVGGGYGKDIDKKVTGNSQSGFTSGLIETAGDMGSYGKGGSAAGMGGNLFDRFAKTDKVEEGYENNPAVLARKNGQKSSGGGMIDGISIPSFGGSGSMSGGGMGQGGGQFSNLLSSRSSSGGSSSGGNYGSYIDLMSNLFSRNNSKPSYVEDTARSRKRPRYRYDFKTGSNVSK